MRDSAERHHGLSECRYAENKAIMDLLRALQRFHVNSLTSKLKSLRHGVNLMSLGLAPVLSILVRGLPFLDGHLCINSFSNCLQGLVRTNGGHNVPFQSVTRTAEDGYQVRT